jgi:hypothetical protein
MRSYQNKNPAHDIIEGAWCGGGGCMLSVGTGACYAHICTYCFAALPVPAPRCPSLPLAAPRCPSLPDAAPRCPSLPLAAPRCPSLPLAAPRCPSLCPENSRAHFQATWRGTTRRTRGPRQWGSILSGTGTLGARGAQPPLQVPAEKVLIEEVKYR